MEKKYPIEEKLNELIEVVQNNVLILGGTPVRGVPHDPNPRITELRDEIIAWEKDQEKDKSRPQGAVWVKGAKGFPVKKLVVAKMFISYLNKEVIGSASSATGEMIVFDWGESAVFLTIDHEELNNLTWLDESATPAKESNEIELSAFFQEGAECWKLEYEMCRKLLQELVDLKNIKETEGKTEDYNLRQPVAWINAKKFLEKFQYMNW